MTSQATPARGTMSGSQWLWLVFLSLLWGGSFFFVGVAVREVPTLTLVLARVGLGAAALWLFIAVRGEAVPRSRAAWTAFAGMALFNNVIPFTAIAAGQALIPSGLASVLNGTTPIWSVILLAILTRDEPLTANRISGVLVGALGVAVLIGPAAVAGQSLSLGGMALVLLGAFSYGISAVWGRRLRQFPPLASAAGQLTCSTLVLLPLALAVDRPWTLAMPSTATIAAVIGLAVLATAVAYLVFFHIIAVSGTANVMLVTLLIPVSAIALGAALLDEVLIPRHFAGAAIIALGLVILDGRALDWFTQRQADDR